jgi:hypothetical protein
LNNQIESCFDQRVSKGFKGFQGFKGFKGFQGFPKVSKGSKGFQRVERVSINLPTHRGTQACKNVREVGPPVDKRCSAATRLVPSMPKLVGLGVSWGVTDPSVAKELCWGVTDPSVPEELCWEDVDPSVDEELCWEVPEPSVDEEPDPVVVLLTGSGL